MDRNQMLVYIAAILSTLLDVDGTPESMLYIAVGMDMSSWEAIKDVMTRCNWISCKGHYVQLTNEGKLKAIEINKAVSK